MAQNLPDEKTVYLALKGVFSGQSGLIRQEKKVRALIQKQQGQAEIKHLIKEHTIVRLSQTAKALLKDQIFESTLKARERFPEVFEVSPDQTAERAVSELAAAENEDAAFQNVAEEHQEKYPQPEENLVVGNIDQNMNPGMVTCDTYGSLTLTRRSRHLWTKTHEANYHWSILIPSLLPVSSPAPPPDQDTIYPRKYMLRLRPEPLPRRPAQRRLGLY
jgi:hypothetical protein